MWVQSYANKISISISAGELLTALYDFILVGDIEHVNSKINEKWRYLIKWSNFGTWCHVHLLWIYYLREINLKKINTNVKFLFNSNYYDFFFNF